MAPTTKERRVELVKTLREAAFKQDPHARAVIEMVKLSLDEAKESLVTAEGEDIHRMQGAARQLRVLFRELTTEPPSTTAPGV